MRGFNSPGRGRGLRLKRNLLPAYLYPESPSSLLSRSLFWQPLCGKFCFGGCYSAAALAGEAAVVSGAAEASAAAVEEDLAASVEARPAGAAQAEAGKERRQAMTEEKMTEEKLIREFVERMRAAAGENLVSVVLYGSAAEGEFHPEYSDLNTLCVLGDASFASLNKIVGVVEWWRGKKHHPPLVLTLTDLRASADVFSIEFVDMKQRHRVLYGEDVLSSLDVPMTLHRSQLEYELREKLFLLSQHVLLAGSDEKQSWEVMLNSLSSFTTLFRHVLLEMGEQGRKHSREAVEDLSARLNFDSSAFVQLIDVRAKKADRKQLRAADFFANDSAAIEKVAAAVDTMQSSHGI